MTTKRLTIFPGDTATHQLLGLRLICLDLRLRRFPLAGLGLSFVAGGLTVKNVVPEKSKIITACKTGDIISVKELFRTGEASPNDVTPENSSPLRVSSPALQCNQLIRALIITVCHRTRIKGAGSSHFGFRSRCYAPFGQFMTLVNKMLQCISIRLSDLC
jgi:hypothetical protein